MEYKIICPYCGHEHSTDKFLQTSADEVETSCDRCKREFLVEIYIKYAFNISKIEE